MLLLLLLGLGARPNPFLPSNSYYVNPTFARNVESLVASSASMLGEERRKELELLRGTPTAIWLDSKSAVASFADVMASSSAQSDPAAVVVVLYNLPNRDCSARASAGEICCHRSLEGSCDMSRAGGCDEGLGEYEWDFIRPFTALVRRYHTVPIVAILEPDSLANLVTNSATMSSCGSNATKSAYVEGIKRAITMLDTEAPHVAVYLDAGHGGWLGWDSVAKDFASQLCGMGLTEGIHGFATNSTAASLKLTSACQCAPALSAHRAAPASHTCDYAVANYNPVGYPCPAAAFVGDDENPAHFCNWIAKDSLCCTASGPCGEELLRTYSS
eukprot:2537612-Prymnesium_polylepis.1